MARNQRYITNEQIRGDKVRVVKEGDNIGVIDRKKAIKMAKDESKDLILIATPKNQPPVCKIMELSKYKYQEQQKKQKAKAKSKQQELKEFRLGVSTSDHDLGIRVRRARNFLKKNDKVRFNLRFKGREVVHPELGREKLEKIIKELSDVSVIEKPIQKKGYQMSVTLGPKT